jgi:hypothetical protein
MSNIIDGAQRSRYTHTCWQLSGPILTSLGPIEYYDRSMMRINKTHHSLAHTRAPITLLNLLHMYRPYRRQVVIVAPRQPTRPSFASSMASRSSSCENKFFSGRLWMDIGGYPTAFQGVLCDSCLVFFLLDQELHSLGRIDRDIPPWFLLYLGGSGMTWMKGLIIDEHGNDEWHAQ